MNKYESLRVFPSILDLGTHTINGRITDLFEKWRYSPDGMTFSELNDVLKSQGLRVGIGDTSSVERWVENTFWWRCPVISTQEPHEIQGTLFVTVNFDPRQQFPTLFTNGTNI